MITDDHLVGFSCTKFNSYIIVWPPGNLIEGQITIMWMALFCVLTWKFQMFISQIPNDGRTKTLPNIPTNRSCPIKSNTGTVTFVNQCMLVPPLCPKPNIIFLDSHRYATIATPNLYVNLRFTNTPNDTAHERV